jgi:hypothetical protein
MIGWREGKVLGSEECKCWEMDYFLSYEQDLYRHRSVVEIMRKEET